MRLGLSELDLGRRGYPVNDIRKKRGVRASGRLDQALRGFDQLSYCYRFKLTRGALTVRLACALARLSPKLL